MAAGTTAGSRTSQSRVLFGSTTAGSGAAVSLCIGRGSKALINQGNGLGTPELAPNPAAAPAVVDPFSIPNTWYSFF